MENVEEMGRATWMRRGSNCEKYSPRRVGKIWDIIQVVEEYVRRPSCFHSPAEENYTILSPQLQLIFLQTLIFSKT
jgi:hypothetical protein